VLTNTQAAPLSLFLRHCRRDFAQTPWYVAPVSGTSPESLIVTMPNAIAFLALGASPLIVFALVGWLRAELALIWSLMLAYLFLPESPTAVDFPLLPPLNKHSLPAIAAFAAMMWKYSDSGPLLPSSHFGKLLVLTFVFSPALTVLTNGEPVFWGRIGLPALAIKDLVALVLLQAMAVMPFLLARRHLACAGAVRDLMVALMAGGLVYSLLMLIEVRLSPQLNLWVYGYFQHFFGQSIRFGGFRPVVFLYHGLWVAFFALTAVVATFGLWRQARRDQKGAAFYLLAALYLTAVLVLAKSLGALIFAIFLVPMVVFLGVKTQVRIALILGILALAYPIMKGADLVPEAYLIDQAGKVDQERANSIEFRFDNERTLLDRAALKPVFGWGSWGRNQILDPYTGNFLTVSDGRWVVTIGIYGWVGFLAEFGLVLFPILLIARETFGRASHELTPLVGAATLILAINLVDMLPNATLTPMTWLLAGCLTGYAEQLRVQRKAMPRARALVRWKPVM
jgi:hypothetical protein